MEREMQVLEVDFRRIEDTHGRNMLDLVLAVGSLRKLLQSAAVVRLLSRSHADLLTELDRIVAVTDLSQAPGRDESSESAR